MYSNFRSRAGQYKVTLRALWLMGIQSCRVSSHCCLNCLAVGRCSVEKLPLFPFWIGLVSPPFSELLCLRFKPALVCGLLAPRGIISREDVHCPFRIGIGRLKLWNPANICLIVRWEGSHCQSQFPPQGLPILGEQIRISTGLPSSGTRMASFGDCILNEWSRFGPRPP